MESRSRLADGEGSQCLHGATDSNLNEEAYRVSPSAIHTRLAHRGTLVKGALQNGCQVQQPGVLA
jgi:hypothetical protein